MLSFNVMSVKPIEEAVGAAALRLKEICEKDYPEEVVFTACRELAALISAIKPSERDYQRDSEAIQRQEA